MGWAKVKNGKLLEKADRVFDVLLTADKGIPHQQNMNGRKIAVVVLRPKRLRFEFIEPMLARILSAIETVASGQIVVVE